MLAWMLRLREPGGRESERDEGGCAEWSSTIAARSFETARGSAPGRAGRRRGRGGEAVVRDERGEREGEGEGEAERVGGRQ